MSGMLAVSSSGWSIAGALVLIGVLAFVLFFPRIPRALRIVLTMITIYGVVDVGFLRNEWFWRACNAHLSFEHVGWRQKDMIKTEVIRREDPWNARYLAVGSSQVWALFRGVIEKENDIRVFNLAGMNPLEAYVYRDIVERHCADTVILYLSELDLARSNSVEGFKLTPPQNLTDLIDVTRVIWSGGEASPSDIAELWISNLFPLYRYQFLFRGILKIATREAKVFKQVDSMALPTEDELRQQIEDISQITDKWFGANIRAVDQFLSWCADRGLNVVVVEGDYHPLARARNRPLREKAHELLVETCAQHPNTRFLSNEELGVFAAQDYMDGTHVYREPGTRFTASLLERLEGERAKVASAEASPATNQTPHE